MIKTIAHTNQQEAQKIYKVFQASYAVEALILKAKIFPPLQRTAINISKTQAIFLGYLKGSTLCAVAEIKLKEHYTHIQSLVVDPQYFKQSIGTKMIQYILAQYPKEKTMVETGIDNYPALNLYKKFGFTPIKQWDTPVGIRKIRLVKHEL